MSDATFQLYNPLEGGEGRSLVIMNATKETAHPIEPAIYIQLQAEAMFGVRLSSVRLSELLVRFYGYRIAEAVAPELIDIRQTRDEADADELYSNEAFERHGLFGAIHQSIPCDVVTVAERLAEVS